jgi:hypothetical protein
MSNLDKPIIQAVDNFNRVKRDILLLSNPSPWLVGIVALLLVVIIWWFQRSSVSGFWTEDGFGKGMVKIHFNPYIWDRTELHIDGIDYSAKIGCGTMLVYDKNSKFMFGGVVDGSVIYLTDGRIWRKTVVGKAANNL